MPVMGSPQQIEKPGMPTSLSRKNIVLRAGKVKDCEDELLQSGVAPNRTAGIVVTLSSFEKQRIAGSLK
jgi:hypothetical protein